MATAEVAVPIAVRRRRKIRWRPGLRRIHKWVSLVTGVLLLIVVLSGTIVLLAPEIDQVTKPELYRSTQTATPVTLAAAVESVNREYPDFKATTAVRDRGVLWVPDEDYLRYAHVDPGTGEVLGTREPYGGIMGFFQNLHMCLLSCEGYTAHVPFMGEHIGLKWGHEGEALTVAGGLLAISAVVLLFLCISGLLLWWPGVKSFARGFKIRRGQGRYKRDYDLHKVIGFAALPFLLVWAITGLNFELRAVGDAWYAIMPGSAPAEPPAFKSDKQLKGSDIGSVAAERAAIAAVGPGATVTSVTLPAPKDKAGYYDVWVADEGLDPYGYGEWPGTVEVAVDRHDPERVAMLYGDPAKTDTFAEKLWEDWSFPLHAGTPVGWLPRTGWVLFGLVPLLLAVTGVSMVLVKRRKRRRRHAAVA